MPIINLTKHNVNISVKTVDDDQDETLILRPSGFVTKLSDDGDDDALILRPSGIVARLLVDSEEAQNHIDIEEGETHIEKWIEVTDVSIGRIIDLPDPTHDTIFVVSFPVAQVAKNRPDVYYPYPLIRNAHGHVVGCGGLGQVVAEIQ